MLNQNCCIQRSSNSADLLCQLVHGAQENDQKAINELCERFTPLIRKIANNSYYKDHLGEDAENIAWVIFLEFIKRYNGNDFVHLPGLLQIHLRYKLLRICKHQEVQRLEVPLVKDEEDEIQLPNHNQYLDDVEFREFIRKILKYLPPAQRIILKLHIVDGYSFDEVCKMTNKPYHSNYSLYRRAIKNIKKLLK